MSTFKSESALSFVNSFFKLIVVHIKTVYTDLDSVKDVPIENLYQNNHLAKYKIAETKSKFFSFSKIHKHYIVPEIITWLLVIDSLYILYCHGFHYSDKTIPELFSHLIYPDKLWKVGDITLLFLFANTLITYFILIFDKQVDSKYVMYFFGSKQHKNNDKAIIQNGQPLSRFETKKIVSFRNKVKQVLPYSAASFVLVIHVFCLYNLFVHWTDSFHWYFTMVGMLVFVIYSVNCKYPILNIICNTCPSFETGNVFMIYYLCMTSQYIFYKLQFKKLQYNNLLDKVSTHIQKKKEFSVENYKNCYWTQFLVLNNQIFSICREITAHNKFWSKYLTFFYLFYVLDCSFYSYGFFFDDSSNIDFYIFKIFFGICTFDFLFIIIYVTWQCSKVVFQNCQIQKIAQVLAKRLILVHQPNIRDMLITDAIASNYKSVKKASFKLLNDYRVDSQMFHLLLTYTTILYLMVFKH